jgi:type IV secretion system protein VirB6
MTLSIYHDIFTNISSSVDGFRGQAAGFIAAAGSIAKLAVGLWILIIGYLTLLGKIQAPIQELLLKCFKLAFIVWIATAAYPTLSDSVWGSRNLFATMVGATSADPFVNLDTFLNKGMGQAGNAWQNVDTQFSNYHATCCIVGNTSYLIAGIEWVFVSVIIIAATIVMSVVAGFLLITATIFLSIGLAIGPLFIISLVAPQFSSYFSSWLGFISSMLFKFMLVAAVLTVAGNCFGAFIDHLNIAQGTVVSMTDNTVYAEETGVAIANVASNATSAMVGWDTWSIIIGILVTGLVMNKLILEVNGLAGSLGGGFAAQASGLGAIIGASGASRVLGMAGNGLKASVRGVGGAAVRGARASSTERAEKRIYQAAAEKAGGEARNRHEAGNRAVDDMRKRAQQSAFAGRLGGSSSRNLNREARATAASYNKGAPDTPAPAPQTDYKALPAFVTKPLLKATSAPASQAAYKALPASRTKLLSKATLAPALQVAAPTPRIGARPVDKALSVPKPKSPSPSSSYVKATLPLGLQVAAPTLRIGARPDYKGLSVPQSKFPPRSSS